MTRVKFYCLFTEKETEMGEQADEKVDEKADEKAVVTSTESPDQSHKVSLIFTAPQCHSSNGVIMNVLSYL